MMKKWRCGVCGYVHDGDAPPDRCPKCGAAKEMFAELQAEAAALLARARFANSLHMRLHALMDEVGEIGRQGVEDNLDPGCAALFKNALEHAAVIQGMIKAEIAGHQAKGKWG